jgi:hypothetical protein
MGVTSIWVSIIRKSRPIHRAILNDLAELRGTPQKRFGFFVEPLDENLKELMKDLGAAINETLSNSEKISEAIAKIRGAGYDVFLVLEATIGFNRRQEEGQPEMEDSAERAYGQAHLNITSQDLKFLKSLKISIDDKDLE